MTKDHLRYEEEILQFWKENSVYEKVQKNNEKGELFNHIDGPPYPTGEIHVGHVRNWSIKDSVLRFKRLQGYSVYARDGYDVHGLPVENKVQKKLGLEKVTDDEADAASLVLAHLMKRQQWDILEKINKKFSNE